MTRARAGHALTGIGLACILWAVVFMNARAIGGPPDGLDFARRRPYDQVKSAVHEAFPGFLLRGLSGLALVVAGRRLAARPA